MRRRFRPPRGRATSLAQSLASVRQRRSPANPKARDAVSIGYTNLARVYSSCRATSLASGVSISRQAVTRDKPSRLPRSLSPPRQHGPRSFPDIPQEGSAYTWWRLLWQEHLEITYNRDRLLVQLVTDEHKTHSIERAKALHVESGTLTVFALAV
eukprot:7263654-Pyramimonas_sp.AAC.2